MVKAKKRETAEWEDKGERLEKASGGERWAKNIFGVLGFAFGIIGLIVYPLPMGILAIAFGYINKKREVINLWKLDIPLGVFNICFFMLALYLISTA